MAAKLKHLAMGRRGQVGIDLGLPFLSGIRAALGSSSCSPSNSLPGVETDWGPLRGNPTITRLEDQIRWYDIASGRDKLTYQILKSVEVVAAALIPFSAGFQLNPWITGGLGVGIVALEGFQQMLQLHANWISYRSTCESLRHEKFLYLAKAGPYADAEDPLTLLATQVEGLVSREHAKWVDSRQPAEIRPGGRR